MDELRSRQQDAASTGHVFQRRTDDRDLWGVRHSARGLPVHHGARSEVFHTTKSGYQPSNRLLCSRNLVVDNNAEIANAFISTGNYYQMLGLTASLGRTIVPDDDRPEAPAVAVISARYWRKRFGSDPNVVGKVVRFNNLPIPIVGVIS